MDLHKGAELRATVEGRLVLAWEEGKLEIRDARPRVVRRHAVFMWHTQKKIKEL
jgi:hypothetical protein